MALRTGSLAVAAAAGKEEALSFAARADGAVESCAARAKQAATRRNSAARERRFPRVREDSKMFMKNELPVMRSLKECPKASQWRKKRVCLRGTLRANYRCPKRSPDLSRAPFANSSAETRLRPSSWTARRLKRVAPPQTISNSSPSRSKVPGGASRFLLDTGSAQRWQEFPRKTLWDPGQGVKPRMRL